MQKSATLASAAAGLLLVGRASAESKQASKETDGTLLKGPDGSLYFLPDSALQAYKLTAAQRAQVEKRFAKNLNGDLLHVEGKGLAASGVKAFKVKNITYVNLSSVRTNVQAYKVVKALAWKK